MHHSRFTLRYVKSLFSSAAKYESIYASPLCVSTLPWRDSNVERLRLLVVSLKGVNYGF